MPGPIQFCQLLDLIVDLRAVVIVIREGVIDFRRRKVRELAQDLIDGQSTSVVLHDGADRKAAPLQYRPGAARRRDEWVQTKRAAYSR
jgi:hypothetical protein